MKISFTLGPDRRDWTLLAGAGLCVPAFIAVVRILILRSTMLGGLGAGFIPLDGPIDGIWPHVCYRIMHNLTHPLLLFVYATVFAYFPLHLRATALGRAHGPAFVLGILLVHAVFVLSFFSSIFLPVGDVTSVIRG